MADKIMDTPPNDETQNYPFCRLQLVIYRLDAQVREPTNQNAIKVTKVVKPTNLVPN